MDAADRDRLDHLDRRIARIEAHLALSPAAAPAGRPASVLPIGSSGAAGPTLAPPGPGPRAVEPPPLPPLAAASIGDPPLDVSGRERIATMASPGGGPVAAAAVPPLTAPGALAASAPAAASAPDVAAPRFDYERFFGLAVLGRIGIAAVVLAGGYFAQLGWGRLGPAARVALLYLVAVALIGSGAWLRPRVAPKYVALLWGGGASLCYLAGVTARLRYELIGPFPALALLVASTALGQGLARILRMQTMATVALALGYAAPLLVGVDTGSPTGFFVYLAALHTWAAITELRWQWHLPRGLAVAATGVLSLGWLATHPPLSTWSLALHGNGLWLALIAPELLAAFARPAANAARAHVVIASAWALQGSLLLRTCGADELPAYALAGGGALLLLGTALRRANIAAGEFGALFSQLGSTLLVVGAYVVGGGSWSFLPTITHPTERMVAVVATAGTLAVLRRLTGAADLAATTAALFGLTIAVAPLANANGQLLALTALIPEGILVTVGASARARGAGLALGGTLAFVAVRLDQSFAPPLQFWLPIAAGATGLWLAAVAALADRRSDPVLREQATVPLLGAHALLAVLAFAIAPIVLQGGIAISDVPTTGLLTGALALVGAVLVAGRGDSARRAARSLADFAGSLVVVGALAAWNAARGGDAAAAFDQPWPRLLSLTAAALLLLGLRRWTVGGDLAALFAALLAAALTVLPEPTSTLRAVTAAWLAIPTVLVLTGRDAWLRCVSLAVAAAALFFAATHEVSFAVDDGLWLSIAFGCSGGAAALGALRAGWRRDRALLATATALLVVLGVVWSIAALEPVPPGSQGLPAFVNLRFLSAIALGALLEFGRRRLPGTAGVVERATFAAIELAVVYLAGLVEMLAAVRAWPDGWNAVTISLYTLLFAGTLLAAGFVRKQSWLRWPGLCGFGIVVVKVTLFDLSGLSTPLRVLAAGILGVVLLVSAYAYARGRGPAARAP